MHKVVMVIVLLSTVACSNQSPSESIESSAVTQLGDVGEGSVQASVDRIRSIDEAIAWLQMKNVENPTKMQLLITMCSKETGATMEGEGAAIITSCIRNRWSEDTPRYADTPDYVPPASQPEMTRDEQIRALMKEDPSSYGYTDADREFLREQGVSEAEARAIEDTLARQGVND